MGYRTTIIEETIIIRRTTIVQEYWPDEPILPRKLNKSSILDYLPPVPEPKPLLDLYKPKPIFELSLPSYGGSGSGGSGSSNSGFSSVRSGSFSSAGRGSFSSVGRR